jgi:hypothetical protein
MQAIVIYDGAGPLPVKASFESQTNAGVVFVLTATARTESAAILTGVELSIDGKAVGGAMCWANQNDNHIAMRSTFIPYENITLGAHTIELNAYLGTITDVNDYFQVTMLY